MANGLYNGIGDDAGCYLSRATLAGYDYRHATRYHHLTELPVDPSHERGRPHGVDGLVLVMVL